MAITNASTLAEYASGISTQGATLTVDANNKRVGIGTTNPQAMLQVGTGVTVFGNAGIASFTSLKLSGETDSTSTTTGALIVTGGVGIGLSLTVGGDVSVGGTITYEDVTNVDSLGIVTARSGVRIVGGGLTCVGVSTFSDDVIFTGAAANVTWDKSTDDLIFNDNAKAIFGTSSDGVEIYHTTASGGYSAIVDSGTGGLVLGSNALSIKNAALNESIAVFTQDAGVDLYYNNSIKLSTNNDGTVTTGIATITGDVSIADKIIHTGDTDTAIRFPSADTVTVETGGTDQLNISTGGVGIADKLLHISDANTSIRFPANNTVTVETGGSERMRITSAGFVGIGSLVPTDTAGAGHCVDIMGGSSGTAIYLRTNTGYTGQINFASSDLTIRTRNATPILFNVNNSERLRIGTSGEIGIAGANYGSSGQVITSAGSGSAVSWATPAVTAFASGANNRIITATSSSAITGSSSFTWDGDQMSVYADTDDTNATLLLVGKTASGGVGQAGRTAIIAESTNNSNGESAMHFRTRNTSNAEKIAMTINGSQFVGIGTENPSKRLHVNDDNSEIARYQSGNASGSYINYKLGANGVELGMIGSGAAILSGGADAADFAIRSAGDLCVSSGGHAERARFDTSGRLLIGNTTSENHQGVQGYLQLIGDDSSDSSMNLTRFSADNWCPFISFGKSRNGTKGSHTVVQNGDYIGYMNFVASDGTDFSNTVASFYAQIDGTPGTDDTPGRFVWKTAKDGENASTERMRLDSQGTLAVKNCTDQTFKLQVDESWGVWGTNTGLAPNSTRTWTISSSTYGHGTFRFGGGDGNYQRAACVIEIGGTMWATSQVYYYNEVLKSSSGASLSITYNTDNVVVSLTSSSNWFYYTASYIQGRRNGSSWATITQG